MSENSNYAWLVKQNAYDMLVKGQFGLVHKHHNKSCCILYILGFAKGRREKEVCANTNCEHCIENWMQTERDTSKGGPFL